jgi:hypothetical protein
VARGQTRWKKTLYTRTGALWMVAGAGESARARFLPEEFDFAYES